MNPSASPLPENIEALGNRLNQHLKPQDITAKLSLKQDCLHILLESASIPNWQTLSPLVETHLNHSTLPQVKKFKIYGRNTGEKKANWLHEIIPPLPKETKPITLKEKAKNGDLEALTTLINQAIQHKNITAKITQKENCLYITLSGEKMPEENIAITLIHRQLNLLKIPTIHLVKIQAQKIDDDIPGWTQELNLQSEKTIIENNFTPEESSQPKATANSSQSKSSSQIKGANILEKALEGYKILLIDVIGSLPAYYQALKEEEAMRISCLFALVYALSLIWSLQGLTPNIALLAGGSRSLEGFTFKLFLFAFIQFISLIAANALTRILFQGKGNIKSDIFIAGVTLLCPATLLFISPILGIFNSEIILFLTLVSLSYTILTLYTGTHLIAKIPQKFAPLAVAVMLISSVWLTKILISSFLT